MANPILILAEQMRGQLSDITFEMLGAGRKLADALGAPLHAVLLGSEAAPLASRLGMADKVLVVDNPGLNMAPATSVAAALKALMGQSQADLLLIGGTNQSMGVGAVLSARTGLPFVNYCRSVRVEGGAVILTSQLFGGKILTDVNLAKLRGVISIYPGAFQTDAGRSDKTPPVEKVDLPVEASKVVFKQYIEPETGDVDITKQNVLVAIGRGIQTQDNVALAEDLAGALSGAVCASRPVIDQGWLPLSRQVGKSGMTVKPRLYLALGISGAPEHWEGMQGSQCIIAVNTDPKAPIFDGAHFGVVGDALEFIPLLTEKVKARKGAG
jgi:electron transfer flavoprotein alpha subunit